ncbi:MAG: 3',5'-cyclic-nucleotide phosphodiesterase [Thermodesulfobacteriota bacterium]|nr:3',5'-cyclic-nucleotide phosphodiesterase [Thermodesulfobacteriota bacterium]
MKVTVLGCYGSELPNFRLTSFLVNESILLDAGSVTASLTQESQNKVEFIFITHSHLDHIKDISFLADNTSISGNNAKSFKVISTKGILDSLTEHLLNNIIWPDFALLPSEGTSALKICPISVNDEFEAGSLKIVATHVNHSFEAVGYLLKGDSGSILYTGDTGPTNNIWKVANETDDLKAIIVEVSFPNRLERLAKISKHLTAKMLERELKKLKNTDICVYCYHMKPQFLEEILKEVSHISPFHVIPLSHGMVLEI